MPKRRRVVEWKVEHHLDEVRPSTGSSLRMQRRSPTGGEAGARRVRADHVESISQEDGCGTRCSEPARAEGGRRLPRLDPQAVRIRFGRWWRSEGGVAAAGACEPSQPCWRPGLPQPAFPADPHGRSAGDPIGPCRGVSTLAARVPVTPTNRSHPAATTSPTASLPASAYACSWTE